jgi:hypothetical protein
MFVSLTGTGCYYNIGGVSGNGQVVIAKNDAFLFGLLNKVFVCNVTPGGVSQCAAAETP